MSLQNTFAPFAKAFNDAAPNAAPISSTVPPFPATSLAYSMNFCDTGSHGVVVKPPDGLCVLRNWPVFSSSDGITTALVDFSSTKTEFCWSTVKRSIFEISQGFGDSSVVDEAKPN